jgi:hypothetical protein
VLKKIVCHIAFLVIASLPLCAQELNCTVTVVSPQIQDAAAQLIFKNLQNAIYQFMNNTKFTNDNFSNQEKIECTLYLNMTAQNAPNDFSATLQVQARRPVYKSSYNSSMLNFQDNNIHIIYQLNQPILFNINAYSDNLTSLLDYYAYMILGYDYDSFALNGGNTCFANAQTVLSNAQNSGEKGWNSTDGDQTRYTLLTNVLDESYFGPLRHALYLYHRMGLDQMYNGADKGRAQVIQALQYVQQVYNDKPGNYNILLFFNAKADEIANIFSEAPNDEKAQVYTILSAIDATDIDKYAKIKAME